MPPPEIRMSYIFKIFLLTYLLLISNGSAARYHLSLEWHQPYWKRECLGCFGRQNRSEDFTLLGVILARPSHLQSLATLTLVSLCLYSISWTTHIFTESAPGLIQSISCYVCLCVCLCHRPGTRTARTVDFWLKNLSLKCQNNETLFIWRFELFIFILNSFSGPQRPSTLFWQTSFLGIVRELAGKGSVAVAAGVGERWQVTGVRPHSTRELWHIPSDWFEIINYF